MANSAGPGEYGLGFVVDVDEYFYLLDTHCYRLTHPKVE